MRLVNAAAVLALCAGVTLFAGAASAQRLDDIFFVVDADDPEFNEASIRPEDTTYEVEGDVEGTGTAGDAVRISYFTNLPTNAHADDHKVEITQSRGSELTFQIESEVPARDLDLTIHPDKCKIDASLNVNTDQASIVVSCSADDLFTDFTADQLASLQAAFLNNKQVKIKVKTDGSKGSITIKLKGSLAEAS